jgi:hypothetical protein
VEAIEVHPDELPGSYEATMASVLGPDWREQLEDDGGNDA